MKFITSFLFILSVYCTAVDSIFDGLFISIRDAPFYAQLATLSAGTLSHFCGGTIISESWILTAGHCIVPDFTKIMRVRVGGIAEGHGLEIEKIIIHGQFEALESGGLDNDIALLKLKKPIEFNEFQQPIKISTRHPQAGDKVLLYGLGLQGRTLGEAPTIKTTEVTAVDQELCNEVTHPALTSFCAGGNGTSDACPGDSGTGSVINGEVAGIVSWGASCPGLTTLKRHDPEEQIPGVYTRVALYQDWIMKNTGIQYQ